MNGHRFDRISKLLMTGDSRRSTLRTLAAGALAIGLGGLGLDEAAAKCVKLGNTCKKKKGKKKKCCGGIKCKGGKCRCSKVQAACTGTFSAQGNSCCGDLGCGTNACGVAGGEKRCCQLIGNTCTSTCDCCFDGAECEGGKCCIGEGGSCFDLVPGTSPCCAGLFCDAQSGVTCQPTP